MYFNMYCPIFIYAHLSLNQIESKNVLKPDFDIREINVC